MEVSSLRIFGTILAGLLIIGLVLGWAIALDEGWPNSTQGVSVIGDNLARVPQGETLVLLYTNKPQELWEITHGDNGVTATCSPCVDPPPATLCGIDCKVTISAGAVNEFK